MRELNIPGTKLYIKLDDEDFDKLWRHNWWLSDDRNYIKATIEGQKCYLHRVIMNVVKGEIVDHIDGDPLNNQRSNLRITTKAGNGMNREINKNNKSGFKGVFKSQSAWIAQIKIDYKSKHLGSFRTAEEAARAYDQKAKEIHGELAVLNFPL